MTKTKEYAKGLEGLRQVMKDQCIHEDSICDIQDMIEQRTMSELAEFEAGLDANDRRLFLWVMFRVLPPETAGDIFARTCLDRQMKERVLEAELKIEADNEEQWAKIDAESRALNEERGGYETKISTQEEQIVWLKNSLAVAESARAASREALWESHKVNDRQREEIKELNEKYVQPIEGIKVLLRG